MSTESVQQRITGRGGARNRKDRVTRQISENAAHGLVSAARFAVREGMPLNRFITVSWFKAGSEEAVASDCIRRFLKNAGDWLRSRGGCFAWLYVRECDPASAIGSHVHILAHVPPELATAFGRRTRGWITSATGWPYVKQTIKSRAVGKNSRTCFDNPEFYAVNLAVALAYVLKAASPQARNSLGLKGIASAGPVIGKRVGTSQNIGQAARNRRPPMM